MSTGAAAAGLTVIVLDPVDTVPLSFVADTVNVNSFAVEGVPDKTPVNGSRARPVGNEPVATAKVGSGYPEAVKVYVEYAVPTVAVVGADTAVNTGAAGAGATVTVMEEVETVPEALVADTANENEPAALGVPESTPALDRASPVGKLPASTANTGAGYPEAVKVYEE